jgi:DNA-binding NtrC family response regulator
LTARFLKEFSEQNGGTVTGIDKKALKALEDYSWPGNVRQLRNIIEKMVVLAAGEKLTIDDIPEEITGPATGTVMPASASTVAAGGSTLAESEKAQILAAIAAHNGNKSRAAEALGISRRTMHRKLNEWNIK